MKEFNPSYLEEKKIVTTEEIEYFKQQNLLLNKEVSDSLSTPGREVIQDGRGGISI